jgi:hypothetical protein
MARTMDVKSIVAAVAVSVAALLASPVNAQLVNPFGRNPATMTEEDFALLREAGRKTLDSGRAGTVEPWRNPATSASGSTRLLRAYTRDGQRCGDLNMVVNNARRQRSASCTLPFSRSPEGPWQIRF